MNTRSHHLAAIVATFLPMGVASELQERGFVVIPGPTRPDRLANAYTAAVASAANDDIRIGSTSTKVNDFVNRGAAFDNLYVFPPLLEACCRVIGRPFKLSSLHARTQRPGSPAQELHVDVPRDSAHSRNMSSRFNPRIRR